MQNKKCASVHYFIIPAAELVMSKKKKTTFFALVYSCGLPLHVFCQLFNF